MLKEYDDRAHEHDARDQEQAGHDRVLNGDDDPTNDYFSRLRPRGFVSVLRGHGATLATEFGCPTRHGLGRPLLLWLVLGTATQAPEEKLADASEIL